MKGQTVDSLGFATIQFCVATRKVPQTIYKQVDDPMDRGAWQATVHGILQARILECIAIIIIIEIIVIITIPIVQMGKLRPREPKQLILSGLPT